MLRYALAYLLGLILFSPNYIVCNVKDDKIQDIYPESNSEHNRVLGLILSFNLGHIDPLVLTMNEYVSMCESG